MKKTFLLLLGLVGAISANASTGYDETLYSWSSDGSSVTQWGGSVTGENGISGWNPVNKVVNTGYPAQDYYTLCVDGVSSKMWSGTPSSTSGYLKFKFDFTLQSGDSIIITAFRSTQTATQGGTLCLLFGDDVSSEALGESDICYKAKFEGSNTKFWPDIKYTTKDLGNDGNVPKTAKIVVEDGVEGLSQLNISRVTSATPVYITSIKIVRHYDSAPSTSADIPCAGGYINTYCYPYSVTVDNATFYEFLGKKDGYVYGKKLDAGSTLKGGTPYLFVPSSDATKITLKRTDLSEAYTPAGHLNGLYGNYGTAVTVSNETSKDYMIFTKSGLVYASDITPNPVKQYGCYVLCNELHDLTESSSAKAVKLFSVEEAADVTTSISEVQREVLGSSMYSISGQRISSAQKGQIYIMNGKKYIAK